MAEKYIVILQSVICSPTTPIELAYSWDGEEFNERNQAISHGFEIRGSDDFNIGILNGRRLVGFSWMDESIDEDLIAVAKKIGLEA